MQFKSLFHTKLITAIRLLSKPASLTLFHCCMACCGAIIALVAGLIPIDEAAQLVNIGTLAAFTVVSTGVIVLRYTHPDMPRPFRTPFSPITPGLGVLFCLYRMTGLPYTTWISFSIWMAAGLLVYFGYSGSHSLLAGTPNKAGSIP